MASSHGSAWTTRTITTAAPGAISVAAADIDGDGDLDVLSASNDDKVAWHENTLGNGTAWVIRTITTNADIVSNVLAADMDGDGDQDAIAASMDGDHVAWYENTAGNGSAWSWRPIVTNLASPFALAVGDIDEDGDFDVVTAPLGIEQVYWLENTAGNGASWVLHTVATVGFVGAVGLADIDGDGDPDVLGADPSFGRVNWHRNQSIHLTACFQSRSTIHAGSESNTVAGIDVDRDGDQDVMLAAQGLSWHENVGGNGSVWTPRTISSPAQAASAAAGGDIDRDGDVDALTTFVFHDRISWFENLGSALSWAERTISTQPNFPTSAELADMDGDGDLDALSASIYDHTVAWYENGALPTPWFRHVVSAAVAGAAAAVAVDLDGDGDRDSVSASFFTDRVWWHENLDGAGATWTARTISDLEDAAYAVRSADVDGDGDRDVISAAYATGTVVWHENVFGNGTVWSRRTITTGILSALDLAVADLDGDGDPDLLSASGGATPAAWYENLAGDGSTWGLHAVATSGVARAESIVTADIDRDGREDAVVGIEPSGPVQGGASWFANRAGQVVFSLADQVPSTVINGDVFSILRLTVTHGGRMGDSDLELARLGLLFEEDLEDVLTSAEANALVEELRIYRDADGNGVFDPVVDTLVATVPTLVLTGGVQTVPFADGDPNVQVAFGTPRTFFVVAQLTANASQQVPHQFRLTHLALGPSATQAEDRSADIPLTIACPADFASRLIVATPVELMGFSVE